MKISMVAAAANNHVIGKDNQLLWHLPEDLKFFKRTTLGFPIVMGRNTFESVGRPLPGRRNVVITTNRGLVLPGCEIVHSVEEALDLLKDQQEIMVVGGALIYRQFLPLAHRIYLTRVNASPEGDTFFPELDTGSWRLMSREAHEPDEKHIYGYAFEVWDKV